MDSEEEIVMAITMASAIQVVPGPELSYASL
jgi:hypothetical protein